ncbi:MAG TPA: carbohydrate porin [Syntrophorhabdales bacterium]|nr:carbohydrate porin [Syntrophorhabdales bacterium]
MASTRGLLTYNSIMKNSPFLSPIFSVLTILNGLFSGTKSFFGYVLIVFFVSVHGIVWAASADTDTKPTWFPQLLGAQFNAVYQNMPSFHSPYIGDNSLRFDHGRGQELTHTYGIYLGSQLTRSLQAYLDVEMFQGEGLSNGVGLGGYANGDVIRSGSVNLSKDPYLARFYLRYLIPLSDQLSEPIPRAMDQLPGQEPTSRIEIKAGKLAPTDDMDQNRYANNARTQFLNYAFMFNTTWDYASDTRGYTMGFSAALVKPSWRLVFGSYQEPKTRNGYILDSDVYRAREDNIELTLQPNGIGTVIRLLAFHNEGRMGDYREAMAIGRATGTIPSTLDDEQPGRTKYGFGFNAEQPLADDGETGLFARAGWANGTNSAWSYTEVDRQASTGLQVSGRHWWRPEDHFGIAYAVQGLTGQHRHYLEAGGIGMLLGDGALNYGSEQIFETYYRIQLGKFVQLSPDYQYIQNPGFNRDRGPVQVYSLRLRLSY